MNDSLKISDNNFNNYKLDSSLDINDIFVHTIKECRKILQTQTKVTQDISCLICCSMLQNQGVKCEVINISKNSFEYQIVVATSIIDNERKYYILDPFFEQAIRTSINYYRNLVLKLESSSKGKDLYNQLLSLGYLECNEIDIKLYCDAIYCSMIEKSQKNKSGMTGEQYFNKLVLKYFP